MKKIESSVEIDEDEQAGIIFPMLTRDSQFVETVMISRNGITENNVTLEATCSRANYEEATTTAAGGKKTLHIFESIFDQSLLLLLSRTTRIGQQSNFSLTSVIVYIFPLVAYDEESKISIFRSRYGLITKFSETPVRSDYIFENSRILEFGGIKFSELCKTEGTEILRNNIIFAVDSSIEGEYISEEFNTDEQLLLEIHDYLNNINIEDDDDDVSSTSCF